MFRAFLVNEVLGDQLMRQQILNLLLLAHLVHGVH